MSMQAANDISFLQSKGIWAVTVAFIGGFCLWSGFYNNIFYFPPLVLGWPICLALLGLNAASCKKALFLGWLSSFAGMSATLYWLALPVRNVGGLPWIPAYLCAFAIAACLACQGGAFSAISYFCRFFRSWSLLLAMAIIWSFLEYGFAIALGFPWLPLSGAFAPWPAMIQGASLFGSYLLGAIWFFGVACIIFSLYQFLPYSSGIIFHLAKKQVITMACAGFAIILLLTLYGQWRLASKPLVLAPQGPDSVGALFVEGNIDQNQKWIPAFQKRSLDIYRTLTFQGLQEYEAILGSSPLILWPETALPFYFQTNQLLAKITRQCAVEAGAPLLFGAPGLEKRNDLPENAVFNRAFLLDPEGNITGYYDKEHLVPFGEYLPAWLDFDFLDALLQGVGIYQEGTAVAPLKYGSLALGMLICYEGIFPWLAQQRVADGANLLTDISNDGWFGDSPAARQHLYLTLLRCVEQNRWMLRSTNTGISAIIDPLGRLVLEGPQFERGALAGRAKLETDCSIYHNYGRWQLVLLAALLLIIIWLENPKEFVGRKR